MHSLNKSAQISEPRDRAALRHLLVQHHAVTEFRAQPFSVWKFNQNLDHVLSRPPRNVGMVVELESISPVRRAKAYLALVAGIRQWAASMNASHSFIHVTTGSNLAATDRLLKAAGARTVGGAYVV